MKNMRCETHNCEVVKVKTRVKKWAYLDKKKQWGYKHSTDVRLICKSGSKSEAISSGCSQDALVKGIKSDGHYNERESNKVISLQERFELGQNVAT